MRKRRKQRRKKEKQSRRRERELLSKNPPSTKTSNAILQVRSLKNRSLNLSSSILPHSLTLSHILSHSLSLTHSRHHRHRRRKKTGVQQKTQSRSSRFTRYDTASSQCSKWAFASGRVFDSEWCFGGQEECGRMDGITFDM